MGPHFYLLLRLDSNKIVKRLVEFFQGQSSTLGSSFSTSFLLVASPHPKIQAVKKQFGGSTVASKRKLFTAMVTVPVVPAGISFPYDPKGDFIPTFSVRPPQTIFFAQNIDPPSFSTKLPIPGDRYGSTAQLAFCNDLLRRHFETTATSATTAKSLSPVQQALVQPFLQNAEVPSHVLRLIRKVVDEFIASPKSAESILEVVLLGPGLDRDDYRRLLNSLITEFEGATWLSTEQLQGMVHMVECAGSFYLVADDLVRILAILRTRLKNTHQQSDDYTYYLVLTISRVVDMMVEGKVKEMSRVTEYEPLSTLLKGLSRDPDMCLKHQATYALQGLLHISFDESRRDFVLQHAGNITMGLLGVASVCKLSVGEVKDGVEQLFKVADELQDVGSKATEGMQSLLGSCEDMLMGIKGSIRSGGHKVWYTALREAQEHIQKGQLADFNHLVFQAPCSREVEFQWGISQLLGEIAIDPLWDMQQ
ncbi:MAG: hypothetical protein J3R72DRAFT_419160 [Linnemannia gamsii]|nr:MAG: hypothetical protein J3R72DRAFT_419160 [Linnemannia gamsii]